MFCMNCGTQLPDGAKFCMNCGTKMGDAPAPSAPVPSQAPAPAPAPSPVPAQPAAMLNTPGDAGMLYTVEDFAALAKILFRIMVRRGTFPALTALINSYVNATKIKDELERMRELIRLLADYDISELKKDLSFQPWNDMAQAAISSYNEDIEDLVPQYAELQGFMLTEENGRMLAREMLDKAVQEMQLVYGSLFSELGHFAGRKTTYLRELDASTDWGFIAKNVAGGAMAAFNPLIGIPMLLGSWFSESKKGTARGEMVDDIVLHLDRVYKILDEAEDKRNDLRETVCTMLTDPLDSMVERKRATLHRLLGAEKTARHYSDGLARVLTLELNNGVCTLDLLIRYIDELPDSIAAKVRTHRALKKKNRKNKAPR